jgi:hypothetical protein
MALFHYNNFTSGKLNTQIMVLELPVLIKELARGKLNTQIMVLHRLFLQLQFMNLPGNSSPKYRNLASAATSMAAAVEVKSHCFLPTPPPPSLAVFPSATASAESPWWGSHRATSLCS